MIDGVKIGGNRRNYMRIKLPFLVVFLSILVLITGGCSMKSDQEAIKEAEKITKETFENKEKVPLNYGIGNKSFYLPNGMEVVDEDESNLILEDKNQTFIVFHNTNENAKSTLNFAAATKKDALNVSSFSDSNGFGYFRVLPEEDNKFELQVGVGGVKVTTYVDKNGLDEDAETMMKIAKSIALQ